MDGFDFDCWTRLLVGESPRRGVVTGLIGTLLAADALAPDSAARKKRRTANSRPLAGLAEERYGVRSEK